MKKNGSWKTFFHSVRKPGALTMIGKVAAGAVSVTALSVGGNAVWKQMEQGTLFHPELFANSQELHGNQITFPENEEYKQSPQSSDSGDNEMLQKDRRAEETMGKENQDRASYEMDAEDPNQYIEEMQQVLVLPDELQQDSSSPLLQSPQAVQDDALLLTKGDGSETETMHGSGKIPSGGSDAAGGSAFIGSDSPSGTGSSGGNGGGGSNSASGSTSTPDQPSEPNQPSGPDNPSVPDTPTPDTPSPTPTPDNPTPDTPGKPSYDPDYPDDTKKPQLPSTPTLPGEDVVIPSFPDAGISSEESDAKLIITDLSSLDSDFLYEGAVLTDWKLLCSVIAYVRTSEGSYRLTGYSDCFKIGEYPDVAGEDLTVSFYFRPNPESEWQEVEHTFYVKHAKVVVMDAADEDGTQKELRTEYLEKNESIRLSTLTRYLYDAHEDWAEWDFFWNREIDKVFPGWSLDPDGETMHDLVFQPEQGGRYVLYPKERQPLPDGYKATYQEGWDPFDDSKYVGRQILTEIPSDERNPVIPDGIQEVSCYFVPTTEEHMLESITIPESLDNMAMIPDVLEAYHVSPYNHVYKEKKGLLYNSDQTKLLGVPVRDTEIEIPSSVEEISLSEKNKLEKITLHSQKPPKLDLTLLQGTVIHIPAGSYLNYVSQWGTELPNGVTIETEEGENRDFRTTQEGVFSGDMTVLYRASENCYGLYEVPEGVVRIAEGAFEEAVHVDSVYLPSSITKLGFDSLNGENISRIYFQGEKPPEISEETFGEAGGDWSESVRVWVPYGCRTEYETAWEQELEPEELDAVLLEGFMLEEENGIRYIEAESDGATLLQVPADVTSFDEIEELTHHTMPWNRIGAVAFGTSEGMEILEIPETVKEIGAYAFSACKDLQVLVSHAEDAVHVGEYAFPGLEIVAFDASYVSFDNGSTVSNMLCLGPIQGTMSWMSGSSIQPYGWGDSYVVKDAEEGSLFYSVFDDADYPEMSYLLWGSSYIKGEIEAPEGHLIREIRPTALEGSEGYFTISEEEASEIYYIGGNAFAHSGLSGTLALSNKINTIDTDAFYDCEQLEEIDFSDQPSDIQLMIMNMAFEYSGLKRVVFPENLFNMGSLVFQNCDNLEEVVFTGETVPILSTYTRGYAYSFGFEENENPVQVTLKDDSWKEAYRDVWKYYYMGYDEDEDRDTIWQAKQRDLIFQLVYGYIWGEVYVDQWPDDQPIYEDDGVTYQENFLNYLNACTDYMTDLTYYNAEKQVCELLDLDDMETEEPVRPDVNDYLEDDEVEIPEEIPVETPADILDLDLIPDTDGEIEEPSTDQTEKKDPEASDSEENTDEKDPEDSGDKDKSDEKAPEDSDDKDKSDEKDPEDSDDKDKSDEKTPEDSDDKDKSDEKDPEDSDDKDKSDEKDPEDSDDKDKSDEKDPEDSDDKDKSDEKAPEDSADKDKSDGKDSEDSDGAEKSDGKNSAISDAGDKTEEKESGTPDASAEPDVL